MNHRAPQAEVPLHGQGCQGGPGEGGGLAGDTGTLGGGGVCWSWGWCGVI